MSLLRHHGRVECPDLDSDKAVDAILASVVNGLLQIRARDIERTGREIRFRGGVLRLVLNTRLSVGITKGRISVDIAPQGTYANYELTFTEDLLVCPFLGGFMGLWWGTVHGWVGGVVFGTGVAVCFFAIPRIITVVRFRCAMRRWVRNPDNRR